MAFSHYFPLISALFCIIFHLLYQLPEFWLVLPPIWINYVFGTKKNQKISSIFLAKVQFLRDKMKNMLFFHYFPLTIPITGILVSFSSHLD